jgi:hypothetical protein
MKSGQHDIHALVRQRQPPHVGVDKPASVIAAAIRRSGHRGCADVASQPEGGVKWKRKKELVLPVSFLKQISLQDALNPRSRRHIASDPSQVLVALLSRCERVQIPVRRSLQLLHYNADRASERRAGESGGGPRYPEEE